MAGRCEKHVFEMTKYMRPYGVTLVAGEQSAVRSFPVEHIEVVHPEIDQDFFKLPIGIDRSKEFVLDQVGVDDELRLVLGHRFAAKFWNVGKGRPTESAKNLHAFLGFE